MVWQTDYKKMIGKRCVLVELRDVASHPRYTIACNVRRYHESATDRYLAWDSQFRDRETGIIFFDTKKHFVRFLGLEV